MIRYTRPPRRKTGSLCRVGEHRFTGISPTASVWLRVSHLLGAFAHLPIFPTNDCCFACVSFHISVLPFPLCFLLFPVLPVLSRSYLPKILLSMPLQVPPPTYFLWHPFMPFPPMYFLYIRYFLISYFPSFPYFPCLSRTSPAKILLSMLALGPSFGVLPSLSLTYFPVLWILPLLCL